MFCLTDAMLRRASGQARFLHLPNLNAVHSVLHVLGGVKNSFEFIRGRAGNSITFIVSPSIIEFCSNGRWQFTPLNAFPSFHKRTKQDTFQPVLIFSDSTNQPDNLRMQRRGASGTKAIESVLLLFVQRL
jgi:hypothetical protein